MVRKRSIEIFIYSLIKRYIDRQKIVQNAMIDLRPDLVVLANGLNQTEEILNLSKKHLNIPQNGYWGDNQEWLYYIHGFGCKLTNASSGEPIEWDAPDILIFDRFWFVNNLRWYMVRYSKNKDVIALSSRVVKSGREMQEVIFDIIDRLKTSGSLTNPNLLNPNKYRVSDDL